MTRRATVVGAGLIGRAWAVVFARAGWRVALTDSDPSALATQRRTIDSMLADMATSGLIADAGATSALITAVPDLATALADADLVQENVPERLDVKLAVFAELDRLAPPRAILASSSSAIPASAFTADLGGRARCLVAHPVNPPHVVPIVELCGAPWTDPAVIASAHALYLGAGQSPIEVKRELPGFILNRLQAAVLGEAFRLVEEGYVTTADLDLTMSHGLGLRWSFIGPFETMDLNAPAGIADYCGRYADTLLALQRDMGAPRPWPPELVAKVTAERRAALPADELAQRQAWRDRRLMELALDRARKANDA